MARSALETTLNYRYSIYGELAKGIAKDVSLDLDAIADEVADEYGAEDSLESALRMPERNPEGGLIGDVKYAATLCAKTALAVLMPIGAIAGMGVGIGTAAAVLDTAVPAGIVHTLNIAGYRVAGSLRWGGLIENLINAVVDGNAPAAKRILSAVGRHVYASGALSSTIVAGTTALLIALAAYGGAAALFFLPVKELEKEENKIAKRAQLKGSTLTWSDFQKKDDAWALMNFLGLAQLTPQGKQIVYALHGSQAVRGPSGDHYPAIGDDILRSGARYSHEIKKAVDELKQNEETGELLASL